MWLKLCVLVMVGVLIVFTTDSSAQDQCGPSGCRLSRDGTYFVTAPKKIRPNQVLQVFVGILKLYYQQINVRVAIKRYDEEVVAVTRRFETEGESLVQMKIPESALPGNYTLRVEGTEDTGSAGFVFVNETELLFDTKQVSVFIDLNKPFYRQGQKVLFRVMPVESNLMSRSGSMDVYVRDATDTVVRRWLSQQTNAGGVLNLNFDLSQQPAYGMWKIEVKAFGHHYKKEFGVDEFFITAIDVNVSMPLYHMEDEFGIAGIIMANLSLGQPVKGTCKVKAAIRLPLKQQEPGVEYQWPTIEREVRYFPGVTDFMFTMAEIREALGKSSAANHELYVEASVYDWFRRYHASGWMITAIYGTDVEMKLLGDPSRTFKPGRPFDLYYAVEHQDGRPLRYFRRQVTIDVTVRSVTGSTRSFEKKMITRDDGTVHFTWVPGELDEFASITAYYDTIQTRRVECTAFRHYSPSNSYIYVTTSTERPQVDHYTVFTVTTNSFVKEVYYLITSGGNIITGGGLEMSSRQKTFSVSVSRDMLPEAHIIAWHVNKGEVIADSLNFYVNGTRLNPSRVFFNLGKDFTKDTIEVTGITDRSGYIAAAVLDYQLWSHGWNIFTTEPDLIRELSTFDSHVNKSFQWTWKLPEEQEYTIHYPAPTYGIDANTTFEYAGLVVFTDTNITRIPHNCNDTLGFHPCMDGSCYTTEQRCDGVRQCQDGQDEMGCPRLFIGGGVDFTPAPYRFGLLTRHYVMTGDWCWAGHFVMPNGRIDAQVSVPDEPKTWVLWGFAISRDLGFGIVHEPVMHEATRPFFMRAEVPETAVKGEQIGVRLALFNYWHEDLESIVMLHDSDEYRFIVVEESGIVSSYNPRTIRGNIQTMVYLEKGKVYETQFPVLPVVDGCITITLSAQTILYRSYQTLEVCTKYDGVTNHLHTPYFVDLINSGSMVLPDLEIPVPERFVKPEERKHQYVPGSPVTQVAISGDVVGPGFYEDFMDAENTLHKPYGGAEQNMYNFAYNLYNLKYQKATNQLAQETLENVLGNLNIVLQRQMSYMNEDGSFSMFRDYQEHTPSTWVTAFVLRTLHDSQQRDWEIEYFYVETDLLNKITMWLTTRQLPSGAFFESSPIYDRKMRSTPIDVDGEMVDATIALTSYVLITLVETKGLTGQAELRKAAAQRQALQYLEPMVSRVTDPYQVAILAYALEAAGSDKRTDAYLKLDKMKRTTNNIYWADKEVPPNEIRMIDTLPYHQPRRWYDNEAYAVETTSYALMTYLRRNYTMAQPIMKWLQSMRNTIAGQASTQDSITALKALVEYAKMDTNRALYNVEYKIQATSMGNFTSTVRLKRQNWPLLQRVNVFPVWGSVRGQVRGTGISLMQLVTKVNVEYPEQIRPKAEQHYFDVNIVNTYTGRNFSIMHSEACAKWSRADISEISGLAVMEVHVPTGYVITNDVLRSYTQSGDVPTLRRAEAYGRKIVFYFDYLFSDDWTCVKFVTDRWFPVANMTIQHLIKVYDYYEPGMHNTTLYTTYDLFNLHICQVCGSFQCPYCPFYNTAPTLGLGLAFSSLLTVVAVTLAHYLQR